jgi:dephospho-CoA kinase
MRPLIVGLTGGIGSGKSTVCAEFYRLGIPIINADQIAREIVAIGQPALTELVNHFGSIVLNSDGSLNRAALRQIIFQQPQQKNFVEELLHPLILKQIKQQLEHISTPYVIIEIPLLIEAEWQPFVDLILVVDLPEGLQQKRIMARDEITRAEIQRIMNSQLPRAERNSHADQLIDNSTTPVQLSQQVSALHQQYLQLAEMRH